MASNDRLDREALAHRRARYLTSVVWHIGAFVIVNAFFWVLDGITGGGVTWAYWISIMWAFPLGFHVLAYAVDGRSLEEHKTQEYLADEDRRRAVAK